MSISTNYAYTGYTQINSQISSAKGADHKQQYAGGADQSMKSAIDAEKSSGGNKAGNPLDSLVESGTITAEQKQAIKDTFDAAKMAYQTQAGAAIASSRATNPLDTLVEAGTITEDQKSAVKSALDSTKNTSKVSPLSAQFQQNLNFNPMTDILDSLVSAGTLTEEQQSAVKSAFQSAMSAYSTQSFPLNNSWANSFDEGI